MGWFIISAVAGLVTYWGAWLVYSQFAAALTNSWQKKTITFIAQILPGVLLFFGIAVTISVLISAWVTHDLPQSVTFLNRFHLIAEVEIAQAVLGIVFGWLAGFTIKNAGELIFHGTSVGGGGNGGESQNGRSKEGGRAHHIWLGGSLMLLVFFGLFAPHISDLIANMTRFKTALFEFEARSSAASHRVGFIERRGGSFGLSMLGWAAKVPNIIDSDVEHLEKVSLTNKSFEIAQISLQATGLNTDSNIAVSRLKAERDDIQETAASYLNTRETLQKFLGPLLICGDSAVSELVDLETIRNALRGPANTFRLILAIPTPDEFDQYEKLARDFVQILNNSRNELASLLQDGSGCPPYHKDLALEVTDVGLFKQNSYVHLSLSMIDVFLRNFSASKNTLINSRDKYGAELNVNFVYAYLLFYERAKFTTYASVLEEMNAIAERKARETAQALRRCEADEKECKGSDDHKKLLALAQRYERAKLGAKNLFIFSAAVDVAEGAKLGEARWHQAINYANALKHKIEDGKGSLGENADLDGAQDTLSFFNIVQESLENKPNKKIILGEITTLQSLEAKLMEELGQASQVEALHIRDSLNYVRAHIGLGVSILGE